MAARRSPSPSRTTTPRRRRRAASTGMTFAVDRATYDSLARRGVFAAQPVDYPWGTLALVVDPDGNEFALLAPAAYLVEDQPQPIPASLATFRARAR